MKNRIASLFCLMFLITTFSQNVRAQRIEDFQNAFRQAADSGFDSLAIAGLFQKYQRFLMPFSQPVQLATALKGQGMVKFPLAWMTTTTVYKDNIGILLDAKQPDKRALGYLMVAASGDIGKRNRLSRELRAGTLPEAEIWLGMGLMYMGYDHTSDIFAWMVRNNARAGNYLFPLLMSLPKDSLRQTAFRFSESKDWNERVYAVQTLAHTGKHAQSEKILRNAIASWPVHLKGYAIVPAQALQIGNLLPLLKPVLDSTATRKVALDALADSPTPSDRAYVLQLAESGKTDSDVLNALKDSHYEKIVIDWLNQLPLLDKNRDYYFNVYRDSVLVRDAMLPYLQKTVAAITNPRVLSYLLPALRGREDSLSQKLLTGFLTDEDQFVRWAAGKTLIGNCSDFLKTALPEIIGSRKFINNSTFDLAIGCGLKGYKDAAEQVYRSVEEYEYLTRMSALGYLATYPEAEHVALFREALQVEPENNTLQTRTASRGLAALGDTASLEAIINVCERERKNSDMNTFIYLDAIARLKCDRSKSYLETYLKSDSDLVKDTVRALLDKW